MANAPGQAQGRYRPHSFGHNGSRRDSVYVLENQGAIAGRSLILNHGFKLIFMITLIF